MKHGKPFKNSLSIGVEKSLIFKLITKINRKKTNIVPILINGERV